MALLDTGNRSRDVLPSINHLDLDHIRSEKSKHSRFPTMSGLNITTAPLGSPITAYSGPPPPYSSAPSTIGSVQGLSGYISPPESNSRRSTRDEKESPSLEKSLPSISEALQNADMPMARSMQTSQSNVAGSGPPAALPQAYAESPKGPSNPYSQLPPPTSSIRDSFSSIAGQPEPLSANRVPQPTDLTESRRPTSQLFGYPGSPRSGPPASVHNGPIPFGGINQPRRQFESNTAPSSYQPEQHQPPPPQQHQHQQQQPRQGYPFPDYHSQQPPTPSRVASTFSFEPTIKFDTHRNPFVKPNNSVPHGETVKRHLDLYDAELALSEVGEASGRTLDFSKSWSQRFHQSNRNGFHSEGFPPVHEIDDMIRQTHRMLESLNKIREVVVTQEAVLSEQRARAARGSYPEDEYQNLNEDYKAGGFAGGDAKKRRGKAAPPGRCHSCNRAETPEWRRGPDGARTLCNACGLHYAKLTRKMGANKAAVMTTSSLRPKTMDPRTPIL